MKVYKTKFKYNGKQLKMNEIIPLSTYYITSGLEIILHSESCHTLRY